MALFVLAIAMFSTVTAFKLSAGPSVDGRLLKCHMKENVIIFYSRSVERPLAHELAAKRSQEKRQSVESTGDWRETCHVKTPC